MSHEIIRIVDDNDAQRDALQFLLESEGYTVRAYSSALRYLTDDIYSQPGCLILDLKMPEMDGLQLQKEINRRGLNIPIVFLSAHGDLPKAVQAMKHGGRDFLEKPIDAPKLLSVIAEVLGEERAKHNGINPQRMRELFSALTERQQKISHLLSQGLLKRQIAERLGISFKTVDAHTQVIYRKLGVHNVAELSVLVKHVFPSANH